MTKIFQATPFLHAPDLERALDLFVRVLRFEVKYRLGEYAYLEREGAAIRILEERGRNLQLEEKVRMTVYIDVADVDALYSELLSELAGLPAGDVAPPTDRPWGQREFMVRLPDRQWLAFGQPSKSSGDIHRSTQMIDYTLDTAHSILFLRPKSQLEQDDFVALAKAVDPHIEERGSLAGVIIEVKAFPGWESLGAMASHFRFVRDHHKHIKKIGIVTDSNLGKVAEHLGSHFVAAEIRHFPAGELEAAKKWIMNLPAR